MPTDQGFQLAPYPDTFEEMMIWIQDPTNTAEQDKNSPALREFHRSIREIALDAAKKKRLPELKAAAREQQLMAERFEAAPSLEAGCATIFGKEVRAKTTDMALVIERLGRLGSELVCSIGSNLCAGRSAVLESQFLQWSVVGNI